MNRREAMFSEIKDDIDKLVNNEIDRISYKLDIDYIEPSMEISFSGGNVSVTFSDASLDRNFTEDNVSFFKEKFNIENIQVNSDSYLSEPDFKEDSMIVLSFNVLPERVPEILTYLILDFYNVKSFEVNSY